MDQAKFEMSWDELNMFLIQYFWRTKKNNMRLPQLPRIENDRKTTEISTVLVGFPRYEAQRAKAVHPAALRISLEQWVRRIQGIPAKAAKISMSERI